ncbi:creatininase family protein [candidate division KSB3 bacterium]|uniref:Creatininase family protein n=1 Tax=candidate division KSB3 bacterium TaxID=2044937 RepID=A0A9D5JZC6_9BACT|nr:creatininase family protein [candidate division KSB3 bacterium]MBD3326950.1 creatininase family protein [candidate division KSB3 bacterium]
MPQKFRLQEFTWIEFQERLQQEPKPLILLPFGSQEEQGPHAPMGDWMLTDVLATKIAEKAEVIAAPTMPFGYADYFRPIPGGIALTPDTFRRVLEDICVNFLEHGIEHLVIFNGHSGNYPLIDQVIRKLKREWGILIPCLNVWRLITPDKWREWHGEWGTSAFGHGGDPLTSVYLHLFPDLVRMDLIELESQKKSFLGLPTAGLNAVKFQGVDVNVALDITDRCDNGIAGGDPTRSAAEIGQKIVDYLVDFTVNFLHHFKTTDPRIFGEAEEE